MTIGSRVNLKERSTQNFLKGVFALLAVLCLVVAITPSAARAQGASGNQLSIAPNANTVRSGDQVSFNINFSCNNPAGCGGATITLPFPSVTGDSAVQLTVTSAQAAAGGITGTPIIDSNARTVTWTLANNVSVGTSASASFVVSTSSATSPNNSQFAPTATYKLRDGSQALTATATTPVTITATPTLGVTKDLVNNGFEGAIPIGGNAIYLLTPTTSSQTAKGTEHFRSIILSDVIPEGSEFVSATLLDGTSVSRADAISNGWYNESTRTFTWPEYQQVTVGSNGFYTTKAVPSATITVNYPNGNFTNGQSVTNVAKISGTSLSNQQITAEGSKSHKLFSGDPKEGPGGAKGPGLYTSQDVYNPTRIDPGASTAFSYNFTNRSSEQQQLVVADNMPCFWSSQADGTTDCDTPFLKNVGFEIGALPLGGTLQVWTNTGQTQTHQIAPRTGASSTKFNPRFSDGSTVTRFELRANLDPGVVASFNVQGVTDISVPALPTSNVYKAERAWAKVQEGERVVENCLETTSGFYSADGSTLNTPLTGNYTAQAGSCGYVVINPIYPRFGIDKYWANVGTGDERLSNFTASNGDTVRVRFQLYAANSPAVVHPIITDLLPAGITYVPDSVETGQMTSYRNYFTEELPDEYMKVEVIDNYNNTGRQLVRISWPGAPGIRAGGTEWDNIVGFQVKLSPRLTSGAYRNQVLAFDENNRNHNDRNTYPNVCNAANVVDTNNLRGLDPADPLNRGCFSQATLNVLAVGAMNLEKTVQNITTDGPIRSSVEWQEIPDGADAILDENRPLVGVGNGEIAEFKLKIENSSSIDLTNILVYDILPFPNDTGTVLANYPRNSEWNSLLRDTDTLEALKTQYPGLKVQYSTSTNPCRGELLGTSYGATASGPDNCVNDWSETPPSNLDDVYGLRFDFGSYQLAAGETIEIPIHVEGNSIRGGVAWNSFAAVAREVTSAGTPGNVVLPTETETVGLTLPSELSIDKNLVEINGDAVTSQDLDQTFIKDGDELTWSLKVLNKGPGWATILRVEDKLAEVLEYASFTAEDSFGNPVEGITYDAEAGVLRFPDGFQLSPANGNLVDSSAPSSVTILLRTNLNDPVSGEQVCNTASVFAAERVQDDSEDDTDKSCVTVGVNVSGTVWDDPNQDGNIDNGELRLSGVTVELRNSDNEVVATTTTNEEGFYEFRGVPSGNYSIHPIDIPERYVINTYDPDGVDTPRVTEITVVDKDVTEQNFGVTYSDSTATASVEGQAEVVNIYKWNVAKTLVSSRLDEDNHPVSIYDITPSVSLEQDSSTYVATVTVTNEGTRDALTASLSEVSSELAEKCTVQGESQVEIPAGQSHYFQIECTFDADRTEFGEDTLTYKVEFPDRPDLSAISGSLTVDVDVEYHNETIELSDPLATTETRTYTADGELTPWRVTWVDTSQVVSPGQCVEVQNTAHATSADDLMDNPGVPADITADKVEICNARVSGGVYLDQDRDGRDLDEVPLYTATPVTVRLLQDDGTEQARQETTGGTFEFTNVPSGTYVVEFIVPADAPVGVTPQVETDTSKIGESGVTDAGSDDPTTRVIRTGSFTVGTNANNRDVPHVDAAVFNYSELEVSSDVAATATYHNSYAWSLRKSVDQERFNVSADSTVNPNYTVTVTHVGPEFVADPGVKLSGTVTLRNDSPVAVQATDMVATASGYVCEAITDTTVPANDEVEITVTCADEDGLTGAASAEDAENEVAGVQLEVTGNSDRGAFTTTATLAADDFALTHNESADENATVSVQDQFGDQAPVTLGTLDARTDDSPQEFTYTQALLARAGECVSYPNTARLVADGLQGDNLEDDATVTVCASGAIDVSVDANVTFDRTFGWELSKRLVNQTTNVASRSATLEYELVTTEKDQADSAYSYSGSATVRNNDEEGSLPWQVAVSATSQQGFECTVTPATATLAPGSELEFAIDCVVPADYSGDLSDVLSVTVERTDAAGEDSVTETFDVQGTDTEFNRTITVEDPTIGFSDTYQWSAAGTEHVERVTWNATLPQELEGCVALTNTAVLKTTDGDQIAEDQAVAHVCSAEVSGHVFIDETEGHTGDDLDEAALFTGDVLVELLDEDGNVVASQTTEDGQFRFTDLDEGTYQVRFTLNDALYTWSLQAQDDPTQLELTGVTDAGVETLNAGVTTITTSQFVLDQERNNIPNIDAAVWAIPPVTPGAGDNASSVDVKATYGYTYQWNINKEVDQNTAEVADGEEHIANYTVTVQANRTLVLGEVTAEVTVAITNDAIRDAKLTGITIEGFGECTLAETISADEPYTVAAGQTATLTANCVLDAEELGNVTSVEELTELLRQRVITVDITQADVTAQPVTFTVQDESPEVTHDDALDENATAGVTDTLLLPNGETFQQQLAEALSGADALEPVVYNYSVPLRKTGSEPEEFVNTAEVDGGNRTSTTVIITEGEDPTPPTPPTDEPTPPSEPSTPPSEPSTPASSSAAPSSEVETSSSAVPTSSSEVETSSSAVPTSSSEVETSSSAAPTSSSEVETSSSAAPTSSSEVVPPSSAEVTSSSEVVPSTSGAVVPPRVTDSSSSVEVTTSYAEKPSVEEPTEEPSTSSPIGSLARTGASVLMVVVLAAALCGLGVIFLSRRGRDEE